jgi:muramidase (phage lysozyme)
MTLAEVQAALANANAAAFLHVIRRGEAGDTQADYTVINGGGHFAAPPWNHPFEGVPTTQGAKACGAYQFLGTTWGNLRKQHPDLLPDFSPACQDIGAILLIADRDALDAIVGGDFETAVARCRPEWTSLPGASETHWTMAQGLAYYASKGGALESAPVAPERPAVAPAPQPAPITATGASMPILALLAAFGPILSTLIPQVAKILNPAPSDVATRNLGAAQTILDTIVAATGTQNIQAAVDKMAPAGKPDPAVVQQVQAAIVTHPDIMPLLNVEGVAEARAADIAVSQADKPFWYGPVSWATVLLLPMIYYTVYMVLSGSAEVSQETKSMVIGFIIGTTLGSIISFYFGTTSQSAKKDETIAKVATSP